MARTEWCIVGLCVGVLVLAIILENFFGFIPCEMCVANRFPYAVIILLTLFSHLVLKRQKLLKSLFSYAVLFAILTGFILTTYQLGLEQGWWREIAACMGGEIAQGMTIEEMMAGLNEPAKACDDPDRILGFSLAELNFIPLLTLLVLWIRRRMYG